MLEPTPRLLVAIIVGGAAGAVMAARVGMTQMPELVALLHSFVGAAAVLVGYSVQLSPLVVLIAVLMGAQLAGVVGALGAIPIAGSIQVILLDWLAHHRRPLVDAGPPSPAELPP